MKSHEVHHMDTELIAERQTMRYHCATCQRCVEDGPEGLRVLHRGDIDAVHHGGSFSVEHGEVGQNALPANPVLH